MQIISSNSLPSKTEPELGLWVYNGLDCAATLKAWNNMQSQAGETTAGSYSFVCGMRAPALEMALRGIKIDMEQRERFLVKYRGDSIRLQSNLDKMTDSVWGKSLNVDSPKQMQAFFYDCMGLPVQYKFSKGERRPSTNRDSLEKLLFHFYAQPIINTVLALRDVEGKLKFLESSIDKDCRLRTSYNVVGTETGRWSSSTDTFDMGGNAQNITDELRRICIADPGMKLGYLDKDQAESRAVAYISGDLNYISACESGDLHTVVCRMVWPSLGWTGNIEQDKAIAERPFYRHFSYRDMAKKLGHGSNYYGQPKTMALHAKIPVELAQSFQEAYFLAFPGIRKWHQAVALQIQTKGYIITALGRKRNFLGRRFDDTTLREAIAYEPQSIVGEALNLFLWRVWKKAPELGVQTLAQIHDAILIQYPSKTESTIIPIIKSLGRTEISFPSGTLVIPISAQVGWNWAKETEINPHGLRKYKSHDARIAPIYKGVLDWEVL